MDSKVQPAINVAQRRLQVGQKTNILVDTGVGLLRRARRQTRTYENSTPQSQQVLQQVLQGLCGWV